MGTSSSHKGPKSKEWTSARRFASDWARGGGGDAGRGVAGVVAGAIGALASGTDGLLGGAGPAAGARLGGLLGGFAQSGTSDPELTAQGLGRLVGLSGLELQLELLRILLPDDEDEGGLERSAVRKAMDEVVVLIAEQMEASDGPWPAPQVEQLVRTFWSEYIAALVLQGLGETILRASPTEADQLEAEIRAFVRAQLQNRLAGQDLLAIDWSGEQGRDISSQIRADVVEVLGVPE